MDMIMAGLWESVSFASIFYTTLGVFMGIIIGAIPGLNATMAIAIAVPITLHMPTVAAIGFLVGVNKGGAFGGSISAITMNIPGSPDAAATCFDGYPMTRKGKGLRALKISLFSSFFGDTVATVLLIVIAAPIATVAMRLGPAELCAIMIFALTLVAELESKNICKGIISAALGMLLSTIGLEPVSSQARLTFGQYYLEGGIPLAAITIGFLAMPELIAQAFSINRPSPAPNNVFAFQHNKQENNFHFKDFLRLLPTLIRSSLVGIGVGIVPGIGGTVSAFLGYGVEKKVSTTPERFGNGVEEGVAAPECANNAVISASLVPLFTLGIPGSVTSALLIGAFVIHGITPGPMMFQTHPQTVYGIYGVMIIGNFLCLAIGYAGLLAFLKVLTCPAKVLFPLLLFTCMIGIYIAESTLSAMVIALCFMLLGYIMKKLDFSVVTFIIGFVLGGPLELNIQQTMISGEGSMHMLFTRPIACAFMALTAFIVIRKILLLLLSVNHTLKIQSLCSSIKILTPKTAIMMFRRYK